MSNYIARGWQKFGWIIIVGIVLLGGMGWYWYSQNNATPDQIIVTPPPALSDSTQVTVTHSSARGVYDYTDAPQHIGEMAQVRGMVVNVYTSKTGTVFLDFCTQYKTCPFSAVIFGDDAAKFPSGITRYQNKIVIASGTIQTYNGQAEMIISNPDQIHVTS